MSPLGRGESDPTDSPLNVDKLMAPCSGCWLSSIMPPFFCVCALGDQDGDLLWLEPPSWLYRAALGRAGFGY